MTDIDSLKTKFHEDMKKLLDEELDHGINSSRFRQMVTDYGGLEAAHKLLKADPPRNTFKYLDNRGLLRLTLEFYVVKEQYEPLFTDLERQTANFRLTYDDSND